MSATIHTLITIGQFESNGQSHEAIIIKFQNKPPQKSWAEWIKSEIRRLGLIPAKQQELEAFVAKFRRHTFMQWTTFIVAIGEFQHDENGNKTHSLMSQNRRDHDLWHLVQGRILGRYQADGNYYLALRKVEQ